MRHRRKDRRGDWVWLLGPYATVTKIGAGRIELSRRQPSLRSAPGKSRASPSQGSARGLVEFSPYATATKVGAGRIPFVTVTRSSAGRIPYATVTKIGAGKGPAVPAGGWATWTCVKLSRRPPSLRSAPGKIPCVTVARIGAGISWGCLARMPPSQRSAQGVLSYPVGHRH